MANGDRRRLPSTSSTPSARPSCAAFLRRLPATTPATTPAPASATTATARAPTTATATTTATTTAAAGSRAVAPRLFAAPLLLGPGLGNLQARAHLIAPRAAAGGSGGTTTRGSLLVRAPPGLADGVGRAGRRGRDAVVAVAAACRALRLLQRRHLGGRQLWLPRPRQRHLGALLPVGKAVLPLLFASLVSLLLKYN